MNEQLEERLRAEFSADAAHAPHPDNLAGLARGRVRTQRIRLAVVTASVVGVTAIAIGAGYLLPGSPIRPPVTDSAASGPPGSNGQVPIERVDSTFEGWMSVAVTASAFDGPCHTELDATASQSKLGTRVTVTATSGPARGCPKELRRVLVKPRPGWAGWNGGLPIIDGATGHRARIGRPGRAAGRDPEHGRSEVRRVFPRHRRPADSDRETLATTGRTAAVRYGRAAAETTK